MGGENSASGATTIAGMERPRRRVGPHTGTLAGLSRAQSLPSLSAGYCVYTLHFRGATRKWTSYMDILFVSFLRIHTHTYITIKYFGKESRSTIWINCANFTDKRLKDIFKNQ